MSGRNLESFMENAEAFDALSEDDKARLFAGEALEGETSQPDPEIKEEGAKESSATPAAAVTDDVTKDTATAEPVILTKDGSHTIPFSVLEAERQRARELEQQLQALQSAATPATTTAPSSEAQPVKADIDADLKALFAERDEAMYSGEVEKASELNVKIFNIQQERATQAAMARIDERDSAKKAEEDQARALSDVEARAAAAAEKYPFLNFQSPEANKDAIDLVVAQRDLLIARGVPLPEALDQAVAKVAPLFAKETTAPETKADVAAKAAEVISKAKAQVPNSLSSVPAGASVHHDEGEAIRNRSGLSLLNSFEGKSADDILKLMSRVI